MKLNDIKSIIKDFEASTLTVLELETDQVKLRLSKNKENEKQDIVQTDKGTETVVSTEVQTAALQKQNVTNNELTIKSPLVGTFYEAPSPEAKPFVQVGDNIKKGQVVCIVEAMKIMNEITSTVDGKIEKINFKNGDVVGFDDVLFTVV